nr:M20/M25/M40 family metallo-hydrolase [Deltaproteobacteria bacterium]
MDLPVELVSYLQKHRARFIDELVEFLKIPSISSLPEHRADVVSAGEWTASRLRAAGMENVVVLPTGGHPVVYGDWMHAPGKQTVMIYGHFDVQPVDPLEKWTHDPFNPTIDQDRIYARGASDDKGNLLIPILAIEAMLKTEGRLPVNVKCLFEGQEEIGSPQLPKFIADRADRLTCDMIISADGGQWEEDQPAILLGLRGLSAIQIDVQGAVGDVHSGTYGGSFLNPIHAPGGIFPSLPEQEGKVAVGGGFLGVEAPPQ